jgi:hypothetical protein
VLISLCKESGYRLEENLEEAATLPCYAVASRYPGETDPITRNEARIAANFAKHVLNWTERQVPKI